jgi:hypothetical protein
MTKRLIRNLLVAAAPFLPSCAGTPASDATTAQQVVEDVARRHRDAVRVTVHATPAGSAQLHAVGSTSAAKRGKPSDPEDLRALETGEAIVLEEGNNLDVTIPMTDAAGKRTWVAGVTLRGSGRTRDQLVADAHVVARELDAAVRAAKQPLW